MSADLRRRSRSRLGDRPARPCEFGRRCDPPPSPRPVDGTDHSRPESELTYPSYWAREVPAHPEYVLWFRGSALFRIRSPLGRVKRKRAGSKGSRLFRIRQSHPAKKSASPTVACAASGMNFARRDAEWPRLRRQIRGLRGSRRSPPAPEPSA